MKALCFRNKYGIIKREKILKPQKDSKGYLHVALCHNNKTKIITIHRLVAKTFIPNTQNKPQVNHINGIKTDNRVENLEWCTASENQLHAFANNLTKRYKGIDNYHYGKPSNKRKKVCQYDLQGNFIKEWESVVEASKKLKLSQGNISSCCRGERKTTGGYMWKYTTYKAENCMTD